MKLVYNIHESRVKFEKVLTSYMVEKTKVVQVPSLAAPSYKLKQPNVQKAKPKA